MAELAEVIGLAMAAQGATDKVVGLTDDDELTEKLEQMHEEGRETEERGSQLADELDGKKTAVLDKARETKGEATEMMSTYLGDEADALDGFEFLTMAGGGRGRPLVGPAQAERAGRRPASAGADRLGAPDSGAALRRREGRLPQAGGTGGSGRGRLAAAAGSFGHVRTALSSRALGGWPSPSRQAIRSHARRAKRICSRRLKSRKPRRITGLGILAGRDTTWMRNSTSPLSVHFQTW
jgi:hypothetical protein